ncbi:hypothetical protein, partial [Pseudomonas sp. NPDC079086]|uniref:hypothetical protein n=1 Tax=unclassified Pseudomonas TaxID=196821 RepID=UPI0037C9B591
MKLAINKITSAILIAAQFTYGLPVYAEQYFSELTPIIQGRPPIASSLKFDKHAPALGETVTLSYAFSDEDGDKEVGTSVEWFRNGQLIAGATSFSYTLNELDGDSPGMILRAAVTPRTDPSTTLPYKGQVAILEITVAGDPKVPPHVTVTDITGSLTVGSTLTGVYVYQDNGSGSKDDSIKSWLNGGHGDTGKEASYVLANDDAGHVLTFQVQAKNLQGVVGNTDSIDTKAATGVTGGGQGGVVIDPAAAPSIRDLSISGKLNVGETLSASYMFDPQTGVEGDASTYLWANTATTATGVTSSTTAVSTTG